MWVYKKFRYKAETYFGVVLAMDGVNGKYEVITTNREIISVPASIILNESIDGTLTQEQKSKLQWFDMAVAVCEKGLSKRGKERTDRLHDYFEMVFRRDMSISLEEFRSELCNRVRDTQGYSLHAFKDMMRNGVTIWLEREYPLSQEMVRYIDKAKMLGCPEYDIYPSLDMEKMAISVLKKFGYIKIPRKVEEAYYSTSIKYNIENKTFKHTIYVKVPSMLTVNSLEKTAQYINEDLGLK